jgi:hypothetical protein
MYDDNIPEGLNKFQSESVEYYFKLWELLQYIRNNPLYTKVMVKDKYGLDDENYYLNLENGIGATLLSSRNNITIEEKDLLFAENEIVDTFFRKVLDLPTFTSKDHIRIRALLKDWYTTQRTLVTKSRQAVKPYYLTSPELDELILSFGFPYPHELNRNEKAEFLHQLIEHYKHKGSPGVLGSVMSFFGNTDVVLSEWWLKYIPSNSGAGNFVMESSPIWPPDRKDDTDLIIRLPYEQFVASDPLWHYDKPGSGEKIREMYFEIDPITGMKNHKITLPSITPYISLNNNIEHNRYSGELSILSRKIQESYEYWVEYELNYVGIKTSYPLNPSRNDVILYTKTNTHHIYNGLNWVDIKCTLPQTLLESDPSCPLKPSRYAPKNIKLNISAEVNSNNMPGLGDSPDVFDFTSNFSLFETILGFYYLLGADYIVGLKRISNIYNGTPVTVNDLQTDSYWTGLTQDRYIVYVEETKTDWITYKEDRTKNSNTPTQLAERVWINLGYVSNFVSSSGEISAVLFIPPEVTDHYIKSYLSYGGDLDSTSGEYPGEYAPLDDKYIDELGDTQEGCSDGIDDVEYDLIIDEYGNLTKKPAIKIDNTLYNWSSSNHKFRDAYYSLRDQRIDRLSEYNKKFNRKRYTEDSEQDSEFLFHPNAFLEAANPILYYSIYNALYIVGITFPLDLLRLNRIREIYINDFSLYLKNIGLTSLGSMTSILIGHSLHKNIFDIINFFKPYRARFKSYLTNYQISSPTFDGMYSNDELFLSGVNQSIEDTIDISDETNTTVMLKFEDGETDVFDAMSRNLFDVFKVVENVIIKDYMRDTMGDELTYAEKYVFKDLTNIYDRVTITTEETIEEPSSPVYDVYDLQDAGGVAVYDANSDELLAELKFSRKTEYGPNILIDYYNDEYSPYSANINKGWIELDSSYTPLSLLLEDYGEELYTDKEWSVSYYEEEGESDIFYTLKSGTIPVTNEKTYRIQIKVKQLNDENFSYNFNVIDDDTLDVLEYKELEEPEGWTDGAWHTLDIEYMSTISGNIYIEFFNLQDGTLIPVELVSVQEKYNIVQEEIPTRYWSYDGENNNLMCGFSDEEGLENIDNYFTYVFSNYQDPVFESLIEKYQWVITGDIDVLDGELNLVISSTFEPEGQINSKTYVSTDEKIDWVFNASEEYPINSLILYLGYGENCKISNFECKRVFTDVI